MEKLVVFIDTSASLYMLQTTILGALKIRFNEAVLTKTRNLSFRQNQEKVMLLCNFRFSQFQKGFNGELITLAN